MKNWKKTSLIITIAFIAGFLSYPLFVSQTYRPTEEFLGFFRDFLDNEGRNYAEAKTAEEKLRLADRMYEKMMVLFLAELGLQGKSNQRIVLSPPPIIEQKIIAEQAVLPTPIPQVEDKPLKRPQSNVQSVRSQYGIGKFNITTIIDLRTSASLPLNHPLVLKILGAFEGKLKIKDFDQFIEKKANLEVNVEEGVTSFKVVDEHDAPDESLSLAKITSEAFRAIPGDENLIMLSMGPRSLLIDLKLYPRLTGKLLALNRVVGDVDLTKKEKSK